MNRILASLSAVGLFAVAATAQCLNVASPGTLIGTGDDTAFATHYALGFSMPVAGSALGSYTHFRVGTNGWIILTNGTTTPAGSPAGGSPYGSDALVAGTVAGYAPRVIPFWRDMTITAPGGLYYDSTSNPGVSCKITFKDTRDYNVLPTKSYQAELFASGEIRMSYSGGMNVVQSASAWVGVSRGNGQTIPTQSDLSAGAASAGVGCVFQSFTTGTFDLADKTLSYMPDGSGGWNVSVICQAAFHAGYGTGCYSFQQAKDTFYQSFATPAAAGPALTGQSMVLTPAGNGYTATWGGGTYVVPSGTATTLTQGDDTEAAVTPSIPFPHVSGPIPTISVASNGYINMGPTGVNSTTAYASVANLRNDTLASFRSNIDYDFTAATSPLGACKTEELVVGLDTILYITYENVERYQAGATSGNSDRVQFQLNLTTGVVTIVWDQVQGITGTGTAAGTLVGYSAAGASFDPGSINLATALPVTTSPDVNQLPLTLSATPAPVFSLGNPSVPVTYTISNVVDAAPPFGVGVAILVFSLGQINPGVDLGFIDMPGCNLYVPSFDVIITPTGTAPTSTFGPVAIPQPLAIGLSFYSQAFSLFAPNGLPNGQNNAGIIASNGLQSYFNTF